MKQRLLLILTAIAATTVHATASTSISQGTVTFIGTIHQSARSGELTGNVMPHGDTAVPMVENWSLAQARQHIQSPVLTFFADYAAKNARVISSTYP